MRSEIFILGKKCKFDKQLKITRITIKLLFFFLHYQFEEKQLIHFCFDVIVDESWVKEFYLI
jgi:hypothetical protein